MGRLRQPRLRSADDVKNLAVPVLAHRITLTAEATFAGNTPEQMIGQILEDVPAPTLGRQRLKHNPPPAYAPHNPKGQGMRHSHTVQRRRTIQRSLRRLKHRIKRLATSYVSPLGWAVAALAVASLVAFVLLGWHELLAMAVVFAVMLAAAVMLSLGNTSFQATIDVSSRRVTVSDTVKVDVCVDNPGRTPTTSARGDLPIGDNHERFAIPMLAAGQSRQTTVEFTAVSRAVLPIGPLSIRKGDPFGLIRHEKKLVDQINVFIHPQTVLLSTLNAGIPRDLEGQPSGEIVDDDLDFYGLREYEPGR